MAVRSFTGLMQKLLSDMQTVDGSTPFRVPAETTSGLEDVTFYFGMDQPRNRNTGKKRYPGWSALFEAPRPNREWATVEDTIWLSEDPEDLSRNIGNVAGPQETFYFDIRIALFAKTQPQFNALVQHLWRIWRVAHGQQRVRWPDDDDATVFHEAQVRLSMLTNRFRPADGVFLSDYLVTVPISLLLEPEEQLPVIETVEFTSALWEEGASQLVTLTPNVFLSLVSGGGQGGLFGEALDAPIVVLLADANGTPLKNRRVNITVTGGGSVSSPNGTTDNLGLYSVVWTLGPSGAQSLSIAATPATGSPLLVTATGI